MSANHVPMHEWDCARCTRRRRRVAAFAQRRAWLASPAGPAGQKAIAKAELLRIKRAQDYANAPADPEHGRHHRHEQGRRARLAAQRRRNNFRQTQTFLMARDAVLPLPVPRVRNAYCAGLGHKWSGWRWRAAGQAMRVCVRGSCQANEIKPTKR